MGLKLRHVVMALALLVPNVVPAQYSPEEIARIAAKWCVPEIDPKIGGFWCIGPDGTIAYSSISYEDAITTIDRMPPPVHKPSFLVNDAPVTWRKIKLDKVTK